MPDKVAIIKCSSYREESVTAAIREMLGHWGGIEKIVSPGQKALIKPNLLCPEPPNHLVTTHPAVIGAVIQLVKEAGGTPIVGDRPVKGSARYVAGQTGIKKVCDRYGAKIIEFGPHVKIASHQHKHYGTLGVARQVLDADVIINLPKLKAHCQLVLTLGVKNMFGGVGLWRRAWRHYISEDKLDEFARMLVATYQIAPPAFTIVDGVTAMEKHGPGGGDPRELGILIGGENAVAVDRVITEILSFPWRNLPTLAAAHKMGLTGCDLSQVKIYGESIKQVQITDFKFPKLDPISFTLYRAVKIIARKVWKTIFAGRNNSGPS